MDDRFRGKSQLNVRTLLDLQDGDDRLGPALSMSGQQGLSLQQARGVGKGRDDGGAASNAQLQQSGVHSRGNGATGVVGNEGSSDNNVDRAASVLGSEGQGLDVADLGDNSTLDTFQDKGSVDLLNKHISLEGTTDDDGDLAFDVLGGRRRSRRGNDSLGSRRSRDSLGRASRSLSTRRSGLIIASCCPETEVTSDLEIHLHQNCSNGYLPKILEAVPPGGRITRLVGRVMFKSVLILVDIFERMGIGYE